MLRAPIRLTRPPNRDACNGPHRVANCPQKQALNAIQATPTATPTEEEEPRMGALRLLNAIKGQVAENKVGGKGLMFVEVSINGPGGHGSYP